MSDLGEHRLKDFPEPVGIFQLGEERFPPLKTISNTNLPRPASSFVGREREVAEVVELLQDGARLVTLSGPGGSGKTRLAIESAADLCRSSGTASSGSVWPPWATRPSSPRPSPRRWAPQTAWPSTSASASFLLLDNFEQVVEAAPELPSLLESCPNLRLLVTSRELLHVRGEVEYPVAPLAESEAVELFCARSRLDASDEIGELCRRLDNLPLAVELAAARTSVLSPPQIMERNSQRLDLLKGGRDSESRQLTLRATIEWSYLLTAEEKLLFARLAVFAGGCTLEAAEEVAEADLDTLQALVEKSLIRFADSRFWMLETISEFALERLEQAGENRQFAMRHAGYYTSLADELRENHSADADRVVASDAGNIRAALAFARAQGDAETQLRLLTAAAGRLAQIHCMTSRARWRMHFRSARPTQSARPRGELPCACGVPTRELRCITRSG